MKFLCKCNYEISESAIEELATGTKQPPGAGGKNLWNRAKRFVELKKQLRWDETSALALVEELFDIAMWGEQQLADPATARLDMELLRAKGCEICQECQIENPDSTTQQILKAVASRLRYQIATREPFVTDVKTDLNIATLWGAKGITA